MDQAITARDLRLEYDIDISGLKVGDKVWIGDLVTDSASQEWDENNDFMWFASGIPVVINGDTYGYLQLGNWGLGENGGDQETNMSHDNTHRDHHELYFVMLKDYKGIGKQHIVMDRNNGANSTLNFDIGPQVFGNRNELNATITLYDHDGNNIKSSNVKFTRPNGQSPVHWGADWVFNNKDDAGNYGDYYSTSFGWSTVMISEEDKPHLDNPSSWHIWTPNNYAITGNISADGDHLPIDYSGGVQVDVAITVFDSNGLPRLSGKVFTANQHIHQIPVEQTKNGLSQEQLGKMLDQNKTYCLVSKQSNGSINMAYNVTADWTKQWIKPIIDDSNKLLKLYMSWDIANDPNPQKALENTINFYKSHDYRPTGLSFWTKPVGEYLDTTVSHKIHGDFKPYNAPSGHNSGYSNDSQSPVTTTLINGQSGIKVHYINGATGENLRHITTSINDPGKTAILSKQNTFLGYELSTNGATKIPTGADVVNNKDSITYPADGTWKDVYLVYMPYSTGHAEARYHYNTVIVSTLLPSLPI